MRKYVIILSLLLACPARLAFSQECSSSSKNVLSLGPSSTKSLPSPDQRWQLVEVGTKSTNENAALYVRDTRSSQKWEIAAIERSGIAFWSEDSRRIFLRDQYAADDTRIRVFEVSASGPKEIEGLDNKIRRATYRRIPQSETTLWLYYPHVCFAANTSTTIIALVDSPVAPKQGGKGKDFDLKLTVHLSPLQILVSAPKVPTFP